VGKIVTGKSKPISGLKEKQPILAILLTVTISSLAVLPVIFDSFITPKMLITSIGLFLVCIFLIRNRSHALNSFGLLERVLILLYISGLTFATFSSKIPLQRAFLGQFGRGNGYGYYILTIFVLIVTFWLWERQHDGLIIFTLKKFSWIIAVYALFQSWGIDIAQIDTTKSKILLTLGNSNFSGGLLSVFFTYNILLASKSKSKKISDILLISLLLYTTFLTGAIQGLVIIFLASILSFNILVRYKYPKNYKNLMYLQFFFLFTSIVFAFINQGPLYSLINRPTFKIRIEYWKIGLKMLHDHLLFGVGPDSFYNYSAQYMAPGSIDILTYTRIDAAHNWFINLAANFGLITLLPILLLFLTTSVRSIALVFATKEIKPEHFAIIMTYLALIVDAMVSIEQPGLGIWLYFFAGLNIAIFLHYKVRPTLKGKIPYISRNLFITLILVGSLFLSTLYIGRVYNDFILRNRIREVLIGKVDLNTAKQIAASANVLSSEPEYASKALDVLARIGDANGLENVSRASLEYYPQSIQSLLMRQEVLRVFKKDKERCQVAEKIIANTPWALDEIEPMLFCASDMNKLKTLSSLLERSQPFLLKKINSVSPTHTSELLKFQTALAYIYLVENKQTLFIRQISLIKALNLKWKTEIEFGKANGATLSPSGEPLLQEYQIEILITNLQNF